MKCPKCQQPGSKQSTQYSHLLTHKCDGYTLEEVSKFSEEDGSKIPGEIYYIDFLEVNSFFFKSFIIPKENNK